MFIDTLPETHPELQKFVSTWQDKPKVQVVEEIASYCQETNRAPDPYYFLITPQGELFSPVAERKIKDVVVRDTLIGKLEYQSLEKIEKWASSDENGVAAWISPPSPGVYPTSKIVISQKELHGKTKVLLNWAIVLDINEVECVKFAQNLEDFSSNRPFLSSIDQIRSNPLFLNTSGKSWTYILEELVPNLSLQCVREGKDQELKNEAVKSAQKIYEELFMKTGRVEMKTMVSKIRGTGMIGGYSGSCSAIVGKTAFQVFSEGEKEYFQCPKCRGKIESGKGITVCPHCGARKEDYQSCV